MLRNVLAGDALAAFKRAADRCFDAIDRREPLPTRYRFNSISRSLILTALADFGLNDPCDLLAPLFTLGIEPLIVEAIGSPWTCNLSHSWLRRKTPEQSSSSRPSQIQDWHQDGALGAHFPAQPGPEVPMTQLLTVWIPLEPCGVDRPGLEFVRRPQPSLLHFTELKDAFLRQRFPDSDFWCPVLDSGDGLVFFNSVLHRTHATAAMHASRTSIEYRIFPQPSPETPA